MFILGVKVGYKVRKLSGFWTDLASLTTFALILFLKTFAVKYALIGPKLFCLGFINGTVGDVLLLVGILLLFKPWQRWKAFWLLDLAITCLLLIDIVYSRYFHDMPSVSLLKQARLAAEVKASVTALLHPGDLRYFVDILLLLPIFWAKRLQQLWARPTISRKKRLTLAAGVLLVGISFIQISLSQLKLEQPGLLQTFSDKKYIATSVGMLNYHAVDISNYLRGQFIKSPLTAGDEQQIAARFDQNVTPPGRYYGSMSGKNLIMVQLESFQGFVLNRQLNGQAITPNLNQLASSSLNFDHTYYQTAWGGTSDAEFLSNVSMLPARTGSAYYEFSGNTYAALPSVLRDQGYFTAALHANKPDFYNRVSMYQALGFEDYESADDFDIDQVFGLGLTDQSFYRQAVAKIQEYQQPFYAFLISLTSHFPFKDDAHPLRDNLNVGEFEGTLMGDYLHAVHYADAALGQFIQELQSAGLWQNSVVVFYGDHAAINVENRDLLAELLYGSENMTDLQWFEAQQVPLLMHVPGDDLQGVKHLAAGQIDIYPTVANLLGFRGQFTLGQDLLNAKKGFVCFRNNAWVTDQVVYMSTAGPLLDLASGQEQAIDRHSQELAKAEQTLHVSDLTLEHDLISTLIMQNGTGY